MSSPAEQSRGALSAARARLAQLAQAPDGAFAAPGALSGTDGLWPAVAAVLTPFAPEAAADDVNAIVAALRQQGLCTLDEAHGLIDLHALAARTDAGALPANGAVARQLASRVGEALERIVRTASATADAAPLQSEYARAASPRSAGTGAADFRTGGDGSTPPRIAPDPDPGAARGEGSRRSSAFVVGFVLLCLVAATVAAVLFTGIGRKDAMAEGIAAYEAGQRVVARLAFERRHGGRSHRPAPVALPGPTLA